MVLICLFQIALILVLNAFGLPLLPGSPDEKELHKILSNEVTRTVTGEVASHEAKDGYQIIILKRAYLVRGGSAFSVGRVRVTDSSGRRFKAGYTLVAKGILKEAEGPRNPGNFDERLYLRTQDISCTMKAASIRVAARGIRPAAEWMLSARSRAKARILAVFPEDVSGVLCAMLIGDKSSLSDESRSLWQTGGITHMLCISGLHLTLLGMGLFRLLRKMKLPPLPAAALAGAVMLAYTIFTGMSVSTVRAFIMFLFSVSAAPLGRTNDLWTSLSLSAILILAENPWYLFYSGFLMSYGAVIICGLFRRRSKGTAALMLFLWMLPLTLSFTFEIPLLGIPVNLLAVPLLPVILALGIAGAILGPIFRPAALPAALLLQELQKALALVRKMPHSSIILGKPGPVRIFIYLICLGVLTFFHARWRRVKKRFLLLLLIPPLILTLAQRPRGHLKITFMDVGQGDGIAVNLPNGMNLLIDSGSSTINNVGSRRVLPCMKALGMQKIDYLFITHTDADHTSGAEEILGLISAGRTSLKIKTLVLPYMKNRSEALSALAGEARGLGISVLFVSAGDSFTLGECRMDILGPDPALHTGSVTDANSQCIVCALHYGAFDALFTGDVYGEAEENAVRRSGYSQFELLKVAHHGSKYSTGSDFLSAVQPSVAVISVGRGNTYGHPSHETLKRLRDSGADVCRTDESGAITVKTDGNRFTISKFVK